MVAQPTGTVTFLFTDIEGSTRLWEEHPEQMPASLARHDHILRQAIEQFDGYVFKTVGDAFCAAFANAQDALAAAVAAQRSLESESWQGPAVRVRMALHSGAADERDGDYFGPPVNQVARLMSAGHGGQVLLSRVSRDLLGDRPPDEVHLADLGKHRLKDLGRPIDIFQLNITGLQTDFPPLKSLSVALTNIPVQVTPFVGRQQEIAALRELILEKDVRHITLTGPGGIGKTRLAIQLAGELLDSFSDGAYFVSLAPLNAPGQIVQATIEALGISFSSGSDLRELLLRYLRRRQMLLIMDNFEHLLEGAPLLVELLQAVPRITLLATSREKLNLSGETVFNLAGLGFADWQSPEELLAHSAGQLFVQSARRAYPAFELRSNDVSPVARICRLVEGVPLAILLAAAWVDMLTPQEIAGEISQGLDLLATEMRDVPPRQRSIRAVFDTSWERLSSPERQLFRKLSVFRGGFTRQAAAKVAGASLRELAALVNKSFLRHDPESGRYELHELLRQYAAELTGFKPEASAAAREAHATHFVELMEQMLEHLRSERQKTALDDIEADIENVRAAWRHLASQGRAADMGRIIETLWYFHEIRGWYHAGLELLDSGETALRVSADDEAREVVTAQIRAVRGYYTTLLGSPRQGREMIEESRDTLRKLDRRQEMLVSLSGSGVTSFFLNRGAEALQAVQEVMDIATDLGQGWWEAHGFAGLASANFLLRHFEDARRYAEKGAERWERIGDPWGSIWPGQVLGGLATVAGNYTEAKEQYQFVLERARTVNFGRGLQYAYNSLGNVSFMLQDYRQAEEYYLQSLGISDEIGHTREMLAALGNIARVWVATDRANEAVEVLATVLQHPASSQHALLVQSTIQEDAEQLRAELEARLPASVFAAAWARGAGRELQNVVDEVLTAGRL